jgi:prepilin-type N-terminal cleavage/methylation domain-containing protein/prepilin-type processing-associated H-X9-DG protein
MNARRLSSASFATLGLHAMNRRGGFTLVELLVVIGIIGILVALLIPAIQYARESARRTTCVNNLKQVALASISHESARRYYATRTNASFGEGTWITSILPYMEESALYERWRSMVTSTKPTLATVTDAFHATPIASLYCPSRRPAGAYPTSLAPRLLSQHSDYAINGGTTTGPDELLWTKPGVWEPSAPGLPTWSGRIFKQIRYKDIKDGLSKTYLVAEKSVDAAQYTSGLDRGDDDSVYQCLHTNCVRFAMRVPARDAVESEAGLHHYNFGSAHASSFNAAYCDGSVHSVSYEISVTTHAAMASRAAGDKVDLSN